MIMSEGNYNLEEKKTQEKRCILYEINRMSVTFNGPNTIYQRISLLNFRSRNLVVQKIVRL